MKIVGVDVGGSFADLIRCDLRRGSIAAHKVPTTPEDPSIGVMAGLGAICRMNGVDPASVGHRFHGTTTATNAVLENQGARTGMITNEGFRDVIHIGRHQRVHPYSIMPELPWQNRPLVARRHRKTVRGHLIPPSGEVLVPLDADEVRTAAGELRAEGVEAVAVCFRFSDLDPAHEEPAKDIVQEAMPGAFVTTSSQVSPQFREFERFTTAALAAFVGPKVGRCIDHRATALQGAGIPAELRIMASNGGVVTPAMVRSKPALTLMSGLAAGVLGGAMVGDLAGRKRLIRFDIGGTSAAIGIVQDGHLAETDARSTSIAGFPIVLPMIDGHTIGAGGGSIAHIDKGSGFRVGPQSAGAVPGPATHGKGGDEPTVTDANIVPGRLDPGNFLGGAMVPDAKASHRVIAELADKLGLTSAETTEGIITISNANMANAVHSRPVRKGIDPRGFALVALGAAGPLHGTEVARQLGIPEVIVPPYPGITSAMGLLTTDLKYDEVRTQFQKAQSADLSRLNSDFHEMATQLAAQYKDGQHPGERDRHDPEVEAISTARGQIAENGVSVQAELHIPVRRQAGRVRDRILPARPVTRRQEAEATSRPFADRQHNRRAARCDGVGRCIRLGHHCPGESRMKGRTQASRKAGASRLDPVTAAVIQGALESIAIEIGHKLMRMSYSNIIRESEDFGAALTDAEGRQLCESKMSTPLQSGPIPGCIRGILKTMGARGDKIEPGDEIEVDLTGAADGIPDKPINMPLEGTVDCAIWQTLRSMLLDSATYGDIPQNSGLARPITIKAPEGGLANPNFPAPVIARFCPGNQLADTVMKALAPAVPGQVSAGIGNLRVVAVSGLNAGKHWVHMEILEGSYGGRNRLDGMDAVDTLHANTRNNPVEDMESQLPLRIDCYELRNWVAAAGKWRGGVGSVRRFTYLADGGFPIAGEGHIYRPWGFDGGRQGTTGQLKLIGRDGTQEALVSKVPYHRMAAKREPGCLRSLRWRLRQSAETVSRHCARRCS